jgi:hypothetical protein
MGGNGWAPSRPVRRLGGAVRCIGELRDDALEIEHAHLFEQGAAARFDMLRVEDRGRLVGDQLPQPLFPLDQRPPAEVLTA